MELIDRQLRELPHLGRPADDGLAVDPNRLDPQFGAVFQHPHPDPAIDGLAFDGSNKDAINFPVPD